MIQVIPENDIKQHSENTTCDCCPTVFFEKGETIVVHHSFDGRENIDEGGMEECEQSPAPKKVHKKRTYHINIPDYKAMITACKKLNESEILLIKETCKIVYNLKK